MVENYSEVLYKEIQSCLLFLIAMLVTSSIAYTKGFYKLDEDRKINITLSYFSFVLFIYLFTSLFIGPMIVKLFTHSISKNNVVAYSVLINFFLNIFTILLLSIFCLKKKSLLTYQIFKKKTEKSSPISKDILLGILSWFIAFPIVSFLSSILEIFVLIIFKIPKLPDQIVIEFLKSTTSHPFYFGLAIIMIVFLAPALEEFLFRGVLQNFLKVYLKRNIAIVITSLIFALFHYSASQKLSNIPILGSLFVLACFLSFLYEKQQSLISPIFLHATFNAVSIINLIFIKGI
jgi:uncharacterized protein